jgi:hypothetical protein
MLGMSTFFFAASISIGTGFETGGGLCMMVEGWGNHKELMAGHCEGDLRQQDQTRDLRENLRYIYDKIVDTHLEGKPQRTL